MKAGRVWMFGAALLALGCGGGEKPPAVADQAAAAVRTAVAETAPVPLLFKAVGSTRPGARATLSTRLTGWVVRVEAEEGDRVRRGQVLVRIGNQDLTARRNQAEAGLEEARAVLANAEKNVGRLRNLRLQNAVPQQQLDEAETSRARALATVAAAEQAWRGAEIDLEYSEVRSPLDGVVAQKFVQAGDLAMPGAPLLVVERQDTIETMVEVSERDRPYVAVGQEVEVQIEVLPADPVRRGKVEAVFPVSDPGSRTFQVKVALPNPGGAIGSGMFARVSFVRGTRPALLVPGAAVVREGQLEGVYVVADGRARLRWVRLGQTWGDRVEVLSGLEAGAQVVIGGQGELKDGGPVEVKGDA